MQPSRRALSVVWPKPIQEKENGWVFYKFAFDFSSSCRLGDDQSTLSHTPFSCLFLLTLVSLQAYEVAPFQNLAAATILLKLF